MMSILSMIIIISTYYWYINHFKKKITKTDAYIKPDKTLIDKKIVTSQNLNIIPKVIYMTYHDIDSIPNSVINNFKNFCKGYTIEIHSDQSCEEFLYENYGNDSVQLFREIPIGAHKADFWRYCILYYKGGYYFDIKTSLKTHIDNIFDISQEKQWFTVICDKKYKSCLYNGIIVTPPLNPVLWDALIYFYTNINVPYMSHVHYLFKLLKMNCKLPIKVGNNIQNNGWNCVLLQENCIACNENEHCSPHKGKNCIIYKNNSEVSNVESTFPWSKKYTLKQTKLLSIKDDNIIREYCKENIAIVGTFSYHYECIGFLLDIIGDKYNIDVYHDDKNGFVELFNITYKFRSFILNRSNINTLKYCRIFILSADDPIDINNTITTRIFHLNNFNLRNKNATEYIKLSPLVNKECKYILPIYNTVFPRIVYPNNNIICIGADSMISSYMANNIKMNIIHFSRKSLQNTVGKNIVNAKAIDIEKAISKAMFVFISKKTDRFSGAIALALSGKTPMIIDKYQSDYYNFPCLVYTDENDFIYKLQNMNQDKYKKLQNEVSNFSDKLIKKNRSICKEYGKASFNLIEIKNESNKTPILWNKKIPMSIFQTHENRFVPIGMANAIKQIKTHAPNCSYTFYDENERQNYIKNNYPSAFIPYMSLIPGAYRSDLFRYIRLYTEGGIYFDTSLIPTKILLKDIIKSDDEFVAPFDRKIDDRDIVISNGFLVSTPKHQILKFAIENILDIVNYQKYMTNPLEITGPILLANAVIEFGLENKGVNIFRPGHVGNSTMKLDNKIIYKKFDKYNEYRIITENSMPHYDTLWKKGNVYLENIRLVEWCPVIIKDPFLTQSVNIVKKYDYIIPTSYNKYFGIADPFIINEYIFAELMKEDKGVICVAKNNTNSLVFTPIIEENYHISYPYVFTYYNNWYMIPESYKSGKIYLYKSINFPYNWEKIGNIIDIDGIDSIPFMINNRWYIFTTSEETQENMLFSTANFPIGPWNLVKTSVLPKGYRGGGQVIYKQGMVILPIQPLSKIYGTRLELYKVEYDLSFTKYIKLDAPFGASGIHHLSYDKNNDLYISDLKWFQI